jgi:hypothetical protein
MPQASDNSWENDGEAIKYLHDRGYRLNRRWCWLLPHPDHEPTPREFGAVRYLIDEWDLGGIVRC